MTSLAVREINAPAHFTDEQVQIIKNSLCKGLSDDEFKMFLYTCQRTALDPFAKQIYAIKRGQQMTIQTGIDGYRLIAERTGCYAPGPEATFAYDKNGQLVSATAHVKKLTRDGTWHNVSCTAYFDEYVQSFNGKPSGLWQKMPRTMLSKCAEALAIRKCCPSDLSGLYTKEEMEQADSEEVIVPSANIEHVKTVEYACQEQIDELRKIIVECDPSKQASMHEYLTKKLVNGKLKAECAPKILELFLDRKADYQAEKMRAIMEGEEISEQ